MASQYPNWGAPDPWAQPDPFAPPGMGQQQPAQFTGQLPPGMGPDTPPWAQTGPTPTPSPIATPDWPQAPQVAPAPLPGPPSAKLAAPWDEKQPKRKAAAPAPAATPQREAPPWESQPDPTMMRGQLEAERAGMQAQANDANAERAGRYAMAAQERLDMARQRDSEQRQDMLAAQSKLDAAAVELGNMRVDPDRYMRNLSTERTVASYVGAVLAGILNPTGPNSMVELTERQIDRDLESQRQDMDQARAGYQAKVSALSALRDIYGDERAAESAYRAEKWGLAGEQIKAEAMASESPLIAKNGEIAYVAALEQSEKYKQQAQQIAIENEQKNRALRTDQYQAETGRKQVGLGYANLTEDRRQFDKSLADKQAERDAKANAAGLDPALVLTDEKGDAFVTPDGRPLAARTEKEAVEARAYVPKMVNMRKNVKELLRLKESYGTENRALNGEGVQRIDALTTDILMDMKELYALGVLAGPDMELLERTVGKGATGVLDREDTPRLKQTLKNIDGRVDSRLRGYGYRGSYTQDIDKATDSFKPGDGGSEDLRATPGLAPRNPAPDPGVRAHDARRSNSEVLGVPSESVEFFTPRRR